MASPARTAASGGVGEPPASSEKTPDEAMPSSPGPVHDQDVAAGCRTISNAVTASPDIDSQAKAIKSKDSENEPVHPGPIRLENMSPEDRAKYILSLLEDSWRNAPQEYEAPSGSRDWFASMPRITSPSQMKSLSSEDLSQQANPSHPSDRTLSQLDNNPDKATTDEDLPQLVEKLELKDNRPSK